MSLAENTAGVDRVVAVVAPDAGVDLTTRLPAGDLGAVRAVASAAGRSFFLATDSGVRYAPFGNPAAAGVTVTSATQVGPTVTVTTAAPHGLAPGQPVTVGGVSVAGYDGTFVVAAAPSATTFTYVSEAVALADGAGGATGGRPHALRLTPVADTITSVGVTPAGGLVAVTAGGPAAVGTGLPTVGGQAVVSLAGFPAGTDTSQVVVSPDGKTAYRADGRTDGTGGLYRYTLAAGVWAEAGAYRFPAAGLFGLAVDFAAASPLVYATTVEAGGGANRLVRFTDAGGVSIAAPVVLATAVGSQYRGVALSPVAAGKPATTTTLTTSAASGPYGAGVTLTATVTSSGGLDLPPAGWVSFRTGTAEVGAAPLKDGVATLATAGNLAVFAGPHAVTAVYTGGPLEAASTSAARSVTITPAPAATTVFVSSDPVPAGSDTTLSAVVAVPAGTRPTGTVTFYDGAAIVGSVQPVAAAPAGGGAVAYRAAVTVPFAAGAKSITAVYSGDNNFTGSTSPPAALTVKAAAGELGFAATAVSAVADPGSLLLTVARAGGAAGAVTVEGFTTDGTAVAGTDYAGIPAAAPFTVSFADGQTAATVPVRLLLPAARYDGSRTFTVTLKNPTGGAALGSTTTATVTLTDPLLKPVGEPAVSGGSVTLAFNRAADPAAARLYDRPGGGGVPDLAVLDAATGLPATTVRGSLVVAPDGRSITFVSSAGVLPTGSYRVQLRAGFRGLGGRPLDGGTYTSGVFTTAAPAGAVLGVRGLARGPGQAVSLPVTLRGAAGVTQAGFTLTYDPTLLTLPAAGAVTLSPEAAAAGLTPGAYSISPLGPRRAVLSVAASGGSGWSPPAAGGTLLTIAGTVPVDAPYGSLGPLDLGGMTANGAAGVGAGGVLAVAFPGDATADRAYSALDAALVAQLGGPTGFAAFPHLDPHVLADVTGDGVADAADAGAIARKGGGASVPGLPDLPPVAATPPVGPAVARLYLENAAAGAGQTVTARLRLSALAAVDLSALDVALRFDPAVVTVSNVRAGSLFGAAGSFTTLAPTVDNATGVLRAAVFAATPGGITVPAGADADVLLFDLTVNPAAAVSASTSIDLLAVVDGNGSRTTTAVSDGAGAVRLSPAPADGADPTDGTLTVLGPGGRLRLGAAAVAAGGEVDVPLVFENGPVPFDLAAVAGAVGFDPADLRAVEVVGRPGLPAECWTLDNAAGVIRFGQAADRPMTLAPGEAIELAVVCFRVPFAAGGTTWVNLRAAATAGGGTTATAVDASGGPVDLLPDPDDAAGDPLDAAVEIAPHANRPPVVAVPPADPAPRLLFNPMSAPGLRAGTPSSFTFSAAGGNPVVVSDPDAGDDPVTVTLRLSGGGTGPVGGLTLATAAGLAVTGDGTAAVTLAGPLAAVNAALDGLRYTPGPGYFGKTTLAVTIDDGGNAGTGGPLSASASTAVEVVGLWVSELMLGPSAGDPAPHQYVELVSSLPDFTIPAGVALVGIEGDAGGDPANNPGLVQDVVRLGGLATGANGYLALLQRGEAYTAAGAVPAGSGGAVLANAPAGAGAADTGFGNGGASSRFVQGTVAFADVHTGQGDGAGPRPGSPADRRTDLERGSASYLLVRSASPVTVGSDIDGDDDGTPGGGASDGWTVLDGVAILDAGAADRAYAPVTFRPVAGRGSVVPGGAVVPTAGWTATYAGRVGPPGGHAPADWTGAAVVAVGGGPAGSFALSDPQATAFPGQRLAHVGAANVWAPRATLAANDGANQRSQVGQLVVSFGRTVDLASLGAFAVRGRGPVGIVVAPRDGRANPDGSYSGVTAVVVRFLSGPDTVSFAKPDPRGNTVGLADGTFALSIADGAVTAGGVPLDGDRDGRPGGVFRGAVRRLFGDVSGDGRVNGEDEAAFRAAEGSVAGGPKYRYEFDAEMDGDIDAADRAAFNANRK